MLTSWPWLLYWPQAVDQVDTQIAASCSRLHPRALGLSHTTTGRPAQAPHASPDIVSALVWMRSPALVAVPAPCDSRARLRCATAYLPCVSCFCAGLSREWLALMLISLERTSVLRAYKEFLLSQGKPFCGPSAGANCCVSVTIVSLPFIQTCGGRRNHADYPVPVDRRRRKLAWRGLGQKI